MVPDLDSVFPVLKIIFVFQLLCSAALLLVVFRYPVLLFKAWQRYLIFKTGFRLHKIDVGSNYQYEYIERGDMKTQEISVLLIHGFTSSKDNWCIMADHLPKRFHVVALDLPGHGGTTRKEKDDLSVPGLVKRIAQFVEAIGLNKKNYHVVGTSLGGCIAGVYSATHPDNIISTTLVCPLGVESSRKSKMFLMYENEKKLVLLPNNEEEFVEMINLLVHKPVKFPKFIVAGVMQVRKKAHSFYMKMLQEIANEKERYILEGKLNSIKAKLLVIWGKHDNILDVSGADVIKEKLPDCQMEILEDCGHSIGLERPRKLASIITKFVDGVS